MNNTEYDSITREQILQMYENLEREFSYLEDLLYSKDSKIDVLEADVDYWRELYEAKHG